MGTPSGKIIPNLLRTYVLRTQEPPDPKRAILLLITTYIRLLVHSLLLVHRTLILGAQSNNSIP